MTKTKKDLMLATYRLIFDQTNPAAMEDLKRDVLPFFLQNCPSLSEPITDVEFDREVAKVRDNLSGIIEYLRHRPLPAALTPAPCAYPHAGTVAPYGRVKP